MKTINDGGPALPFQCQGRSTGPEIYYGMTLRDYFASQVLVGLSKGACDADAARNAYALADAMLAERAK